MSEIVDLLKFREAKQKCEVVETASNESDKHMLSGDAICSACRHQFAAKMQAPVSMFECPACGAHRAVFMGPVLLPEKALVAQCNTCEGQLWMMTTEGQFCIGCGGYFVWPDLPPVA